MPRISENLFGSDTNGADYLTIKLEGDGASLLVRGPSEVASIYFSPLSLRLLGRRLVKIADGLEANIDNSGEAPC